MSERTPRHRLGFAVSLALHILLADGRELSAPLSWFPVLEKATPAQRANWRLMEGVVMCGSSWATNRPA